MSRKNPFVRFYFTRPRLIYALALGIVAAFAIPLHERDWVLHAIIGWNVTSYVYLVFVWTMMLRADETDVRRLAQGQDENAFVVLTMVSLAALMSLAAIVLELASSKAGTPEHTFHLAMTAATVIGSWFVIPTIFGLHYAHSFYLVEDRSKPSLQFPDPEARPDYWDFMYFSFTIAVASQTADIAVGNRSMRKAVLGQAVLSFFFNASILALSINVSASLVSG